MEQHEPEMTEAQKNEAERIKKLQINIPLATEEIETILKKYNFGLRVDHTIRIYPIQ